MPRRSVLASIALTAISFACVPPAPKDNGSGSGGAHEGGNAHAAAGEGGGGGADGDCGAYADALCEQAGPESATCKSAKSTTKIMASAACAAGLANMDESKTKIASMGDVCSDLQTRLCGDVGEDTESCKMVKGQIPAMPPEQCEQMTERYDEVLASLQEMEQRNKPLTPDKVEKLLAGEPPTFGPDDAQVTVVEFSDFQCPYCSKAADAVHEIEKKYGKQARVIFRQFPLQMHPQAHLAAQASLAAHAQGKFGPYHDKLFENQRALSREDLDKYAKELGLDMAKFKKALDEETFKADVDAELELGREVYVGGTPTMFVNGERVSNPTDMGSISEAIDKAIQG